MIENQICDYCRYSNNLPVCSESCPWPTTQCFNFGCPEYESFPVCLIKCPYSNTMSLLPPDSPIYRSLGIVRDYWVIPPDGRRAELVGSDSIILVDPKKGVRTIRPDCSQNPNSMYSQYGITRIHTREDLPQDHIPWFKRQRRETKIMQEKQDEILRYLMLVGFKKPDLFFFNNDQLYTFVDPSIVNEHGDCACPVAWSVSFAPQMIPFVPSYGGVSLGSWWNSMYKNRELMKQSPDLSYHRIRPDGLEYLWGGNLNYQIISIFDNFELVEESVKNRLEIRMKNAAREVDWRSKMLRERDEEIAQNRLRWAAEKNERERIAGQGQVPTRVQVPYAPKRR